MPHAGEIALNRRHAEHCRQALSALGALDSTDEIIVAEGLRRANGALARITGDTGVEAMLDALFAKFCIGK